MPHTSSTEELEIIEAGGGGKPPSLAGGDDDGSPRGRSGLPQRVYITGIAIGMGAILMFFMAFASAFIVRKGVGSDWQAFPMPRILWLNTLILLASSLTIVRARHFFTRCDGESFRHWWTVTTILGFLFLAGQVIAWRDRK